MHKIGLFFVVICLNLVFKSSFAAPSNQILHVNSNQEIDLKDLVNKISPGDIVLVGESHAIQGEENLDQKNQVLLIQALVQKYKNVSVGMEFIGFLHQQNLDLYLSNKLSESNFLNEIDWGQNPYEDYKAQINSPLAGFGWTYGLNAPKGLTSYVGKNGIENLPPDLSIYLPPNFQLGSEVYKNRFMDQMSFLSHHGMNLDYYFQAQSIWDDTMAWNATEIMKSKPTQILVIIVGQFHVTYGDGLPARLRARGINNVISIIQSSAYSDLNPTEEKELLNHPTYGLISDYYW